MDEHERPLPQPVTDAGLEACGAVRHGFFTRAGGVSEGLYAGLNAGLGSGDDPANVHENRRRIAGWLGADPATLSGCHQVHSADVVAVDAPVPAGARARADALVTATPGLPIAVLTADCAPVLFADAGAGVIGAAHAGWKGALAGIVDNTVEAMIGLGARRARIRAVVGPAIGQASYEVGPEFRARFDGAGSDNGRHFAAGGSPDRSRFDLVGYCLARLAAAGVVASTTGRCTYADEARFFSYRRTTHRGEPDYGRQMSAIMLV